MERVVVDASVAVKWFVTERDSNKALQLRDSYQGQKIELVAPNLIYYEVANALRFHPHYGLTEADLLDSITALRDMQIALDMTADIWLQAFDVSLSQGVSVYDAVYMAMSIVLDVKLVTGDRRLVEKLGESSRNRITLLEEIKPSD
nr:type II toxin-antitoxin system VapC family toxin [Candidatus Njordarchaeota archaeon]